MTIKLLRQKALWNHRMFFKRAISAEARKAVVRIGCSSGFWGDTQTSSSQLVQHGNIDYLVSDYLSEITMSLMTAAKRKDNAKGFAPDFVSFALAPQLEQIKKKGIRIVSNAGGTNPMACSHALQIAAKKMGLSFDVAVILGDDVMPQISTIINYADRFKDMQSNMAFPGKAMTSMNAYLGAEPIKKALDMGAEIVITGRCVDSALILGPLMHEFDWDIKDYDKLACGSLAGHLLECGAQATGGIFTDWQSVPDWDNIGFPIAECYENGKFLITKPPATGGLVTPATVSEQLVYEIGNPAKYMLPDVTCDFRNVSLTAQSEDSVLVQGAKGSPPLWKLKVCGTYMDGYRTTAVFSIFGKRAIAKGYRTAESIIKRVRGIYSKLGLSDFKNVHIQAIGDEYAYGERARKYGDDGPRETVVWLAVEHEKKEALQLFSLEIAAAGTGMAPGLSGLIGGRPKVSPVLKLFSFLHHKSNVPAYISYKDVETKVVHCTEDRMQEVEPLDIPDDNVQTESHTFILEDLAYARSGDKGNHCNIGVIARHPSYVPYLRRHLTADVVYKYFKHLFGAQKGDSPVTRFELPGINAFNFVLKNCLAGGGVASLRPDPQGKSYAQMLLDIEIKNLPDLVNQASSS